MGAARLGRAGRLMAIRARGQRREMWNRTALYPALLVAATLRQAQPRPCGTSGSTGRGRGCRLYKSKRLSRKLLVTCSSPAQHAPRRPLGALGTSASCVMPPRRPQYVSQRASAHPIARSCRPAPRLATANAGPSGAGAPRRPLFSLTPSRFVSSAQNPKVPNELTKPPRAMDQLYTVRPILGARECVLCINMHNSPPPPSSSSWRSPPLR